MFTFVLTVYNIYLQSRYFCDYIQQKVGSKITHRQDFLLVYIIFVSVAPMSSHSAFSLQVKPTNSYIFFNLHLRETVSLLMTVSATDESSHSCNQSFFAMYHCLLPLASILSSQSFFLNLSVPKPASLRSACNKLSKFEQ